MWYDCGMTQAFRLSRTHLAILFAVVIVAAAVVAVVVIPRCSVFVQKLTGIAARVTNDSSLAMAAQCTQSSNSQVYFVSCGGFF